MTPEAANILRQMYAGKALRRTWGADAKAYLGLAAVDLEVVVRLVGAGLILAKKTTNGYTRYTPTFKARKALRQATIKNQR